MALTRIKYIGSAERYFETPITGSQQSWHKGQASFVDAAYVPAFVATGLFEVDAVGESIPAQPDLPTLITNYPAASNAGKSAVANKETYDADGKTWARVAKGGPYRNFTGALKKLGATAYDLTTHATVGVTALTRSLTGDYPRFSTATIKCDCTASTSQIRFQSISATADPDDQLLTIDVYIPFHPDEFGSTRYPATTNPTIDIRLCNTTSGTADSWTFSFTAVYMRKGWNTLKMWAGDTVGSAGTGTLAMGAARTVGGAGISFLSAVQYCEITFNNMNGKSVYVDQLRRGAKARTKLVMGFDASGSAYNDTIFPDKVAPLFAQYGTTGYTTLTNVYEMLYSGGASWLRQIDLYERFGWDVLNHTWSHGATTVGRNQTVTAARTGGNLVTITAQAAHNIPVGTVYWSAIRGSTDAAANGVFKCTATTATKFTYASTGSDGDLGGTITWCTFLSEVFDGTDSSLQSLLNHEIGDVSRTMRAVGFQRSAHIGAYPNNMVPELGMLKTAAADAGLVLCRAVRSGMCSQNEFGIDNPLNFGSIEMGSGAAGTTTTYVNQKLQGAIGRGDHMWTYGHYVLDETTLGTAVDLEYPPSLGGNPAPPAASLSGAGGWWYLGQIKRFLTESVGPAIASGDLELMTPTQFADFVGLRG